MTKMTKEQAVELLKNRKVYVNGQSAEIQEKLFELGFRWNNGSTTVSDTDAPFLFISSQKRILQDCDMDYFMRCNEKEISADEILSIEVVEECPFKPFDRVLVRDLANELWSCDIFSFMRNGKYICSGGSGWQYCIPYVGNEHLVGTTNTEE